ncbi:hypothetical protein [Sphingobacterium thalpophilum]|uniref:hypothetical protein n=1 Tax=Sphingobacterium thalpophilum TaxID=259 RepID=UPI0031D21B1F
MLKPLYTRRSLHFYFWLVYAIYFYLVNLLGNKEMSVMASLLTVPYFALVFYAVSEILSRYYRKGKKLVAALLLLAFYTLSGLLIFQVLYGQWSIKIINGAYVVPDYRFSWGQYLQSLLVIHGNFTVLALLYYNYKGKLNELQAKLAAEDKMQSHEYAALSAQVAPHVMANIFMNWRHRLLHMDRELAAQVEETYKLMKFYMDAHNESAVRCVLLADEVGALQRFLKIQRTVETTPFFIDVHTTGNLMRFTIPPTTLQTLVGNLFKHADIADCSCPARIDVQVKHSGYTIRVSNRKRNRAARTPSHGVGLRNLRARMKYIYGDGFTMAEKKADEHYELMMDIQVVETGARAN